jgi:hypothetical protein
MRLPDGQRNPRFPPGVKENSLNQCDGCRRGLPINAFGNHTEGPGGLAVMACEKDRYLAEVTTLLPYREIVTMLRKMANDIEAGDFGQAEDAVFILQSDQGVKVFGWGKALMPNSIGLIELGKAQLFRVWFDCEASRK